MLSKFKVVISIIFLSFFLTGCEENKFGDLFWPDDEDDVICGADTTPVVFKKVGFWSEEILDSIDDNGPQDLSNDYKSINYKTLTTLNYAYIGVNDKGEMNDFSSQAIHDRFEDVLKKAKAVNPSIKVGLSIGNDDASFNTIAQSNSALNTFAKNIAACLEGNQSGYSPCNGVKLDGVDLYWKYPIGKEEAKRYLKMVKVVSEKIRSLKNKYFTITIVSGTNKDQGKGIRDEVFQYIDYANVMAFNSEESGELYAEMDDAKKAISYWAGRCVVKNKIVLGVPFYSGGTPTKESFMSIAGGTSPSKERACKDSSKNRHYNGIPTVIEKTQYAKSHAGGIMMRYIQHDIFSPAESSLLDAIHKTAGGTAVTTCP